MIEYENIFPNLT